MKQENFVTEISSACLRLNQLLKIIHYHPNKKVLVLCMEKGEAEIESYIFSHAAKSKSKTSTDPNRIPAELMQGHPIILWVYQQCKKDLSFPSCKQGSIFQGTALQKNSLAGTEQIVHMSSFSKLKLVFKKYQM